MREWAVFPRRFALIGAGGYGASHLRLLRQLRAEGKIALKAVADPSEAAAAGVKRELSAEGTAWYEDFREMLSEEPQMDGVVICSPIHLHESMAAEVLAKTAARILLEKPAVPTIQQLDRLIAQDPERRVRVGFQMISWPSVKAIKRVLAEGRGGIIRRVIVSAGQPRPSAYYRRTPWAGRLMEEGMPVFDGVATNAAAHLLHLALHFACPGEGEFGVPERVVGEFYRAREIQGYDFAWMRAAAGPAELHVAVAHCVEEETPFSIRIETDRGAILFLNNGLQIRGEGVFEDLRREGGSFGKTGLYESLLARNSRFNSEPVTLSDTRGYALLTCGALISSGRIRAIPRRAGLEEQGDVPGLTKYLRGFAKDPKPPSSHFSWGQRSEWVECGNIDRLDLDRFCRTADELVS